MAPSTPPAPLPEDHHNNSSQDAIGEKTQHIEPENEMQVAESNKSSTMTSSIANDVDDAPAIEEKTVVEPPKPAVEYPKGLEAFFIMVALVLSITLCSLDQVSSTNGSLWTASSVNATLPDSRKTDSLLRPLLQPPFPKLPTNSTALTTSRGMAHLIS